MIKKCLICGEDFETIEHGESRKYCFNCSPSYKKGDNSGRANAITAIRHALKAALVKQKGGKCEKCGYDKCLASFDFHHKNPNEKDFAIAEYCSGNNVKVEKAFEEIKKCALLCANCHREFHSLNSEKGMTFEEFLEN